MSVSRSGDNIIASNSIFSYTFANIISGKEKQWNDLGYDSNNWLLFYIGFGPIDNFNSNFEVWILIWQSSIYSNSEWSIIADLTSLYDSPNYYYIDFGLGMQGPVSNLYMTYQYLKFPSIFLQNGDTRNSTRSTWFNSIYEYEPNWIGLPGWGNGVLKSSLDITPGEICDDGNNINGDRAQNNRSYTFINYLKFDENL